MKVQLETITSQINRSFSLMFNPKLSDLFFWHSHPEYELVYIKAISGSRHVGDHISTFERNDLVLIGANIPHLNFDYGIKTDYEKVVVHFKKEFVDFHFQHVPELYLVKMLFDNSKKGVAFDGEELDRVGERLFKLEGLAPFEQYLQLMDILQEIAQLKNKELLHNNDYRTQYSNRDQERLRTIHAYIDENYQNKVELEDVADACYMSKEAFCRYFKKMTTYTFVEFLNRYRISHSKRILMSGESISEACFQSGFQSLSYFNRVFKKVTNENPSNFKKKYRSRQ